MAIIIGEKVIGRTEEANIGKLAIGYTAEADGIGGGVTGVENIAHEKVNCRKNLFIPGSFSSLVLIFFE